MKILRILAALIFLIGGVYFISALLLLVVLSMDETSQMLGEGSKFRAVLVAVIGLASVVGAAGLFTAQEWARKLWPLFAALVVLFHVIWFIVDLLRTSVAVRDWLTLLMVILVYVASAVYALRPDTRTFFRSAKI